jgi:predicted N-acetyltransferase YhbS
VGEIIPLPGEELRAPERLTDAHDLSGFSSTEPTLDDWLRKRALAGEGRTARTYVVCAGRRVVGFYVLANGGVQRSVAPSKLRRNAPNPVPVMVLGRLAVDKEWEGQGIGKAMLRDAILRTLGAAEVAGIGAILVHAISNRAKAFYLVFGFMPSDLESMTLMITLAEAAAELSRQA